MEGWIKLHRQLLEWEWFNDSCTYHVFTYCLLSANHQDKRWCGVDVKAGSFITSLGKISEHTGIGVQRIRTSLKRLKSTQELTIRTTTKYTVITVNKWNEYQETNTTTNKQLTNNQQTTNKQLTTNKNDKNVENEKNEKKIIRPKTLNLKEIESSNPPYTPPLTEMLDETIKHFNDRLGKRYKSTKSLLGNFEKWTEVYSLDEIKSAIDVLPRHHFWKDKMTPTILFRTMGRDKNPVDYIGDLLNYSPTSTTIEPKDNLKNWI